MGMLTSPHRNLEVNQNWQHSIEVPVNVLAYKGVKDPRLTHLGFLLTAILMERKEEHTRARNAIQASCNPRHFVGG